MCYYEIISSSLLGNIISLAGFGITIYQLLKSKNQIEETRIAVNRAIQRMENNNLREILDDIQNQQKSFIDFQRKININGISKDKLITQINDIRKEISNILKRISVTYEDIREKLEMIDGNISNLENEIKKGNTSNIDTKEIEIDFKVCITELKKIIRKNDDT